MNLLDTPIARLDGSPATLAELTGGKVTLVVNVASRCGLTPQYTGLEALQRELEPDGFTVLGIPCNQFGGQEPGTAGEIQEFCSATYGVTFPLTEKIEVNGAGRHPLYQELTAVPDTDGQAGDIQWNFEKFLLAKDGSVVARFRPATDPGDPALRAAIQDALG
ncbi:glutathione peroxidase [Streptomyces sp. NBC_01803]|uniref:glutathione peroxidase n=1 Tax=Streptomyces sp. NBC_01803 TaxID=2975946 RepID=UPI002DDAAE21|nr:glutathione peroxidase [Streptomyces sp. NBC_01803]WSA43793.1 glutathione peroxidase [Streptomyces sp. NBC_01803]